MAADVGIKELLEAGVHFGHQTRRWNPKMRRFIHGERTGIYIIDLLQTQRLLGQAQDFAAELARRGGTILFVGTKKQARDAVRDVAESAGMPYVHHRWLGGLLTNFQTINNRIRRLHDLERYETEGQLALLPTRERMAAQADLAKLRANLGGVKHMQRTPDAVFVIDLKTEAIAVREAQRLRIPTHRPRRHELRPGRHRLRHPGQRRRDPLVLPRRPRDRRRRRPRAARPSAPRRRARAWRPRRPAPRGRGAPAPRGRGAGPPPGRQAAGRGGDDGRGWRRPRRGRGRGRARRARSWAGRSPTPTRRSPSRRRPRRRARTPARRPAGPGEPAPPAIDPTPDPASPPASEVDAETQTQTAEAEAQPSPADEPERRPAARGAGRAGAARPQTDSPSETQEQNA